MRVITRGSRRQTERQERQRGRDRQKRTDRSRLKQRET